MRRPRDNIVAFGAACIVLLGHLVVAQAASDDRRLLQPALAYAADYSPVYPTTTFPAGTRRITVVFRLAPGESFNNFVGQFIAVDTGRAAPPNFSLARKEFTSHVKTGDFHLDLPRPFPAGRYRLDVTGDGRPWKSVEFVVAAHALAVPQLPVGHLVPLTDGQAWSYNFLLETGPGVRVTLPNRKPDADGKFRGDETERIVGHDADGAHVEMHLGPSPLEEWWQLKSQGLVITRRKLQGELYVLDPPQIILPWPPNTPQSWNWQHKDPAVEIRQTSHMWGPVPVAGPNGRVPGYVVLVQETEPNSPSTTFEREYLPGFGMVHEVLIEAIQGNLLLRQELTLKK